MTVVFLIIDIAWRRWCRPDHAVDPAALVIVQRADAQRRDAVDQRQIHHAVALVVEAAALGAAHHGVHRAGEIVQIRLIAHEVNGTAHGARAVQRALGSAQHFDAVDVEEARLGGARGVDVEHVDGHIVEINAGGGGTRLGAHAADLDVVLAGTAAAGERQVRDGARQIGVVGDVLVLRVPCSRPR
jgi:hypothetical protein